MLGPEQSRWYINELKWQWRIWSDVKRETWSFRQIYTAERGAKIKRIFWALQT